MIDDLYKYENELKAKGIKYIGGVDEVGRGPLIGPVVAACCVLEDNFVLDGLTDSKKLSEKKRDEYYSYLIKHSTYGIGIVSPEEIDEINIYEASKKAMLQAIKEVRKKVNLEHVLIDAMPLDLDIESTSIIKGDSKSISIAAASVIAKVTRDKMMYELDLKYPMYGFKNHKGYPTKKHIEAINKYGLIEGYRKTYGPVKELLKHEMHLDTIEVGYLKCNCYILNKDNNILIIDPGDELEKILPFIKDKNLLAILITHHHFDHVGALKSLKEIVDTKIFDFNNFSKYVTIGPFNFEMIKTPGHKEDSVTYYFKEEKKMFTGDFLFKESIGRTDLLGGNELDMIKSIKKIKKYDDDIKIYPGHGEVTNLGDEKKNNIYLKKEDDNYEN